MSPHWHYATLFVEANDCLVRSMISPESDLTYERAHAEIQSMLDWLAAERSGCRSVAEMWRRGAQDDWVYIGGLSLTVYECSDCVAGAQALLDDFAAELRRGGVDVGVVRIPPGW